MIKRHNSDSASGRKKLLSVAERRGRKKKKESERPGIPLTFAYGPGDTGEGTKDLKAFANEAFKRGSEQRFSIGLIAAVVTHLAVFQAFPRMEAEVLTTQVTALEMMELPPEVRIPPPPETISRPATPKVAALEIDEEITIGRTTFEANPAYELPPPPREVRTVLADRPVFIPYTTAPNLQNRLEVLDYLGELYPRWARKAGLKETVILYLFIDEEGLVQRTVVVQPSQHGGFDAAAVEASKHMVWTPALNRDRATPVWLMQSIEFNPPGPGGARHGAAFMPAAG